MDNKVYNRIGITLITIFTACVAYYILKDANWVLGDDAQQYIFTGMGKYMPLNTYSFGQNGITMGRLAPFAHMEYNIVPLLGMRSALAHYSINAILFVAYVLLSMSFCREVMLYRFGRNNMLLSALAFMILYCASQAVFGVLEVFSHQFQFTLLALVAFLFARYYRTGGKWNLYLSVPVVLYMTFSSETNFILFITVGVAIMILDYHNMTIRKYGIFLIFAAFSYIIAYIVFALPNKGSFYEPIPSSGSFLVHVFVWLPEVVVLFVFVAYRLWRVFIKKEQSCVPSDALLAGGGMMTLAFLVLGLRLDYYYMYTSFYILPTLVIEFQRLLENNKRIFVIVSAVLLCFFIRPLHLFPYIIKNDQQVRREDIADVKNVIRYIGNNCNTIYFLKAQIPDGDFANNFHIAKSGFIKYYISFVNEHQAKAEDVYVNSKDEVLGRQYLFVCSDDMSYLKDEEKAKLKNRYDSVAILRSMNTVLYKRKTND